MAPYPGDNWNRIECYKNMGFDEFMDLDALPDLDQLREQGLGQGKDMFQLKLEEQP